MMWYKNIGIRGGFHFLSVPVPVLVWFRFGWCLDLGWGGSGRSGGGEGGCRAGEEELWWWLCVVGGGECGCVSVRLCLSLS